MRRELAEAQALSNRNISQMCYGCSSLMRAGGDDRWIWIESANRMMCPQCQEENACTCFNCGLIETGGSFRRVREEDDSYSYLCGSCCANDRENEALIMECRGCGDYYHTNSPSFTEGLGNRCVNCCNHVRETGQILMRSIRKDPSLIECTRGDIVTSFRPFGIELETVGKKKNGAKMSYELAPTVGLTTDGSIQKKTDDEIGLEIQTPPASGARAEALIRETCKTINKYNFGVNTSCGYHIHIDVNDLDEHGANSQLEATKRIWMIYLTFEDVLLSFLPQSRQDNIRYCAALKSEYHLKEIMEARNMDALEALWYRLKNKGDVNRAKQEHRHPSRYRGINLHPMFSDGHIEIRYHSGTTLPSKILEWANLHTRIIDTCMNSGIGNTDWWFRMANSIDLDTKTDMFFRVLDFPDKHRDYFYARQEAFRKKRAVKKSDAFKAGMETLETEKEQ